MCPIFVYTCSLFKIVVIATITTDCNEQTQHPQLVLVPSTFWFTYHMTRSSNLAENVHLEIKIGFNVNIKCVCVCVCVSTNGFPKIIRREKIHVYLSNLIMHKSIAMEI